MIRFARLKRDNCACIESRSERHIESKTPGSTPNFANGLLVLGRCSFTPDRTKSASSVTELLSLCAQAHLARVIVLRHFLSWMSFDFTVLGRRRAVLAGRWAELAAVAFAFVVRFEVAFRFSPEGTVTSGTAVPKARNIL